MSSDTTSEYPDDDLSDISAERLSNHVVVGQKPRTFDRRTEKNFLRKLFTREVRILTFKKTTERCFPADSTCPHSTPVKLT